MRLSRDERRVIVADLAEQGMSTRAIAPVVGVKSDQTIRADLAQVRDDHAPNVPAAHTFEPSPWDPAVNRDTGEIKTAAVTGLDGKTYQRPEPKERTPKRRPLAETTPWEPASLGKRPSLRLAPLLDPLPQKRPPALTPLTTVRPRLLSPLIFESA